MVAPTIAKISRLPLSLNWRQFCNKSRGSIYSPIVQKNRENNTSFVVPSVPVTFGVSCIYWKILGQWLAADFCEPVWFEFANTSDCHFIRCKTQTNLLPSILSFHGPVSWIPWPTQLVSRKVLKLDDKKEACLVSRATHSDDLSWFQGLHCGLDLRTKKTNF